MAGWLASRGSRQLSRRSRAFWRLVVGPVPGAQPAAEPVAGELWGELWPL